ncbi:MAG TPA: hypothetical protein VE760_07615, partial [Acidimicrobiales bacterium]|nr:hypothetical protein [Acidimicrobiales bacterium]
MPAVVRDVPNRERPWLDFSVNWFMDQNAHAVPLAASGPKEWPRVSLHDVRSTSKQVGSSVAVDTPPRRPVSGTGVTRIKSTDNSISFDVDRPGSPVLVKASYFPNWKVSGGKGPWRVTPNLMVVLPTSRHVTLHYGFTGPEVLGWVLTLAGIAAVVRFARRGRVDFEAEWEAGPVPEAEELDHELAPASLDGPAPQPVTVRRRDT